MSLASSPAGRSRFLSCRRAPSQRQSLQRLPSPGGTRVPGEAGRGSWAEQAPWPPDPRGSQPCPGL